jgi:membrane protein YqaA with SNARE-associated domain
MSILAFVQVTASKAAHHAARHGHGALPHWLIHLGAPGVFGVSALDASVLPLPLPGSTDLLLLVLTARHGNPWLLASLAVLGSAIGGYLTWGTGKKGGQAALHRYVSQRYVDRIAKWVEGHTVLATVVPAVLPPPIPLLPFVLAAGALGVSRNRFLLGFTTARTLRYGLVAWLGVHYGRAVVHAWQKYVAGWSTPIICTLAGITGIGVAYGIWKLRRIKKAEAEGGNFKTNNSQPLPAAGK